MKISYFFAKLVWLAGCCYLCRASAERCISDFDCEKGYYCGPVYDKSGTSDGSSPEIEYLCAPCLNCPELQRWSLRVCGQGPLGQCGDCVDGYQESVNSRVDLTPSLPCELITKDNSSFRMGAVSQTSQDSDDSLVKSASSSATLMTSQVLILAGIALAAIVAAALSVVLGRVYHKRLSKRSYETIARLEEFNRKLPEIPPTSHSTEQLVYWDQLENWNQKEKA